MGIKCHYLWENSCETDLKKKAFLKQNQSNPERKSAVDKKKRLTTVQNLKSCWFQDVKLCRRQCQ